MQLMSAVKFVKSRMYAGALYISSLKPKPRMRVSSKHVFRKVALYICKHSAPMKGSKLLQEVIEILQ
jgi:hypothetical protein